MKNILFLIICFLTFSGYAQNDNSGQTKAERNAEFNERPLKDRMAYGGELSLFFGNTTYINISPFAGYRINPDLTFGLGPTYQYISVRNNNYQVYQDNIFGGRAFLRHELGRMFFVHGEYEILNLKAYSQFTGLGRKNVEMAALGFGYKSSMGEFAYYYFMVLYDFIQSPYTPYATSPIIIKGGIMFGK